MPSRLYVGNLAFEVGETALETFFSDNGIKVEKVQLIRDTATGRSRGFGFVQLEPGCDVEAAIKASDGKEVGGRQVTVNEARERSQDSGGGNRGGKGRRGGRF